MRYQDPIEKHVSKFVLRGTEAADERNVNDALAAYERSKTKPTAGYQLLLWRMIMNRPIMKLAVAAVIVIGFGIGVYLMDRGATPAWAIEESIEALRDFHAIEATGTTVDADGEPVSFQLWARANEDQTASNHLRIETEDGAVDVTCGDKRYQYDPTAAIVKVTEGYGPAISPWPGAKFFESMRTFVSDWEETYGKDPATNRDRVFATCSHPAGSGPGPRSWWFEFDVESKLLVSMKQWENVKREGVPRVDVTSIIFLESLPDELFEFEIPEGAEVVSDFIEK